MSTVLSHDSRTIRLHWITAALVVGLWILGQTIDDFPKGDPRVFARSLHITFGVLLGIVLVLRIRWRLGGGTRLPPIDTNALGRISTLTHRLLYALLIGTVLLGLTNVWGRGDTLFNLFKVPAFDPANRALRETVENLHAWCANTLLIVAGGHAAAALLHHFALKDGVLRRMLPRR